MICVSVINFALFDKIKKEIRWKEEEKPSFNDIKVTIKGEEKYKKVIPGKYLIKYFKFIIRQIYLEKINFITILINF